VGLIAALALWWLFHRTRWACSSAPPRSIARWSRPSASIRRLLFTSVFVLGSALAGLGGALQVPRQALTNVMDTTIITEAFVVVRHRGHGLAAGRAAGRGAHRRDRRARRALAAAGLARDDVRRHGGRAHRPAVGPARPPRDAASRPTGAPAAEITLGRRWVLAALVLLLVAPAVVPRFWVLVLVEILVYALFAASLHLLMGTGGMVSFGHGRHLRPRRLRGGAAGAGGQGADAAGVRGGAGGGRARLGAHRLLRVRLTSIYFAMLTLAFCQIAYAIVHQWYDVTGGDNGVLGVWPPRWLADPVRYYYLALVTCAGGIALLAAAGRAPFGLTLRAIRDHARRAEASGIDVRLHQWRAFVLAGFLGGLAGATFVFLKGSVFPNSLTVATSVQPLVMVLLGGVGALAGAPIGAALYTLLDTLVTKLHGVLAARRGRHPDRAGGGVPARPRRAARRAPPWLTPRCCASRDCASRSAAWWPWPA
jgi:branched-chain amino acid transport system permease protein